MGDVKASTSGGVRRRVLALSAGASHTVALLCKKPSIDPFCAFTKFFSSQLISLSSEEFLASNFEVKVVSLLYFSSTHSVSPYISHARKNSQFCSPFS